jgi:hypothetical protein
MARFIIVLKNKKEKTYILISWLIIALNVISFAYLGVMKKANPGDIPFYAAGLLILIAVFGRVSRSETIEHDCIVLSFCLAIIAWIVIRFYWAGALTLLLFIFQEISRRKLIVVVYEDRIIYPSFPKREITWNELNNAIMKDGILTIDLKNDKILQEEVISPTSEMEFNEFCEEKLKPGSAGQQ